MTARSPWGPLLVTTLAALTATLLAGTRALDELWARRGECEAALALGCVPGTFVVLLGGGGPIQPRSPSWWG